MKKKIAAFLVSALFLALVLVRIDLKETLAALHACETGWLAASLLLFIPLTLLSAWRLQLLVPPESRLDLRRSIELSLAAGALNTLTLSKAGDLLKGCALLKEKPQGKTSGLALSIYEKLCDLGVLAALGLTGMMLAPLSIQGLGVFKGVLTVIAVLGLCFVFTPRFALRFLSFTLKLLPKSMHNRYGEALNAGYWNAVGFLDFPFQKSLQVFFFTLLLWTLILLQIWFLVLALGGGVGFIPHLGMMTLALFAGLAPLTVSGAGSRDLAIFALYAPFMSGSTAAAFGILCTGRYLFLSALGLPFLNEFSGMFKSRKTAAV